MGGLKESLDHNSGWTEEQALFFELDTTQIALSLDKVIVTDTTWRPAILSESLQKIVEELESGGITTHALKYQRLLTNTIVISIVVVIISRTSLDLYPLSSKARSMLNPMKASLIVLNLCLSYHRTKTFAYDTVS